MGDGDGFSLFVLLLCGQNFFTFLFGPFRKETDKFLWGPALNPNRKFSPNRLSSGCGFVVVVGLSFGFANLHIPFLPVQVNFYFLFPFLEY
jgi:hypothetical protein